LKLKLLFDTFDFDKNGFIERCDFQSYVDGLAKLLKVDPSTDEYKKMAEANLGWFDQIKAAADTNKDGRVSEAEWMAFWTTFLAAAAINAPGTMALLRTSAETTFHVLDMNKNLKIAPEEFRTWLAAWQITEGWHEAFKKLDVHNQGYLTKTEVTNLVKDYFLSNDPTAPGNWLYCHNPGIMPDSPAPAAVAAAV